MAKKRKRKSSVLSHDGKEIERETAVMARGFEALGKSPISTDEVPPSSSTASSRKRRRKEKRRKQKSSSSATIEDAIARVDEPQKDHPSLQPPVADFPYPTEADDHCESPLEAYRDIEPILKALRQGRDDIALYDPYYCDGAATRNLRELGFDNIYHRKEDCYEIWKDRARLPAFDVLVTNPPYSADHISRLMHFLASPAIKGKAWLLLLPNWVVKKDYYQKAVRDIRPFYVVSRKRYVYLPPSGFREKKHSDVHKKSSPFVSMWYIWGGNNAMNEKLIQRYPSACRSGTIRCDLARSKSALRDLRRKKRH